MPNQADEGLWLVGYIVPCTHTLSIVQEGLPERAARREAKRLNQLGEAEDARLLAIAINPPAERRLAPGFYSDERP